MYPITRFWPALALTLLAATVSAQQTPPAASRPGDAPPKLEPIEEGSDTPITVTARPNNEAKVSEHREQGVVKEIKVTSGPSTYYIKPNPPSGTSLPGDATNSAVRAPQWKVLEFDIGGKKKKQREDESPVDDGVPPPPPAK